MDTSVDPPTLGEADFRTILDARIYRLYGRHLNNITHPTP